jgi:membrane protein implicated in regulation of membrane protease activity
MAWIVWIAIAVVMLIVEVITVDLEAIWFAVAAIAMTIITACAPQLHVAWQIFIFAVLSVGLLIATRPLVKNILKKRRNQETNLDLIVNHTAVVVEDINNDLSAGAVKINGLVWTARSTSGELIEKYVLVTIKQINGNKLFVERKNSEK